MATPGRNDPCPCGSRRKYKHCCGLAQAAPAPAGLDPYQVGALVALVDQERLSEAEQRTRALLRQHSAAGILWKILGVVLMRQGRDALPALRTAAQLLPEDGEAHGNLGAALRDQGLGTEALASLRRAVDLRPRDVDAHNDLGLVLASLGQLEEAAETFRLALALNPRHVEALNNLGNVLRDLGERREAVSLYRRAIECDPGRAESHCNLGNALLEYPRIEEAEASYRQALALQPGSALAHVSLGTALRLQGRTDDAEASCRAALAIDPDYVEALSLLGELCADQGRFAAAEAAFQRALAIDPDFPFAFFGIAAHRKMTREDTAWLEGARALLAKRLPLRHAIGLRYALGKYHDDLGQYANAFDHYRHANELSKRYGAVYDRVKLSQRIDAIIDGFDAASIRRCQEYASDSALPVFVIGMPRSGTSLAEQILASHPAVFGAGELTFWGTAFGTYEAAGLKGHLAATLLPGMAADYQARLTALCGSALRVVDKMPANFLYAGLIHAAFPRARIIHMRRHPLDTCLSIYFQNFFNMAPYANDLDDLAHYYAEYRRITDHWRAVLPADTLLEVPYEALIDDQESWTRRMLDFIGLPWDPRCLDFHLTERVVITSSKWQVRQKIHGASAGRWRHYAEFLGPLRALLDPAPST